MIGEDFKNLYLESVEVGVEYGKPSIKIATISWILYLFSLEYTTEPLLG